jgi:hypothetical protein
VFRSGIALSLTKPSSSTSKSKRTVTAYGVHDKVIAEYPATIGGVHDPLPIGDWKIVGVERNPWFNYDPVHFWNASPDAATAKLPPCVC